MQAPDGAVVQLIDKDGYQALNALDGVQEGSPDSADKVVEAVRALVRLRDGLIILQRADNNCGGWLDNANALLSTIFGMEFPVNGLKWQRVKEARDSLRRMLAEMAGAG